MLDELELLEETIVPMKDETVLVEPTRMAVRESEKHEVVNKLEAPPPLKQSAYFKEESIEAPADSFDLEKSEYDMGLTELFPKSKTQFMNYDASEKNIESPIWIPDDGKQMFKSRESLKEIPNQEPEDKNQNIFSDRVTVLMSPVSPTQIVSIVGDKLDETMKMQDFKRKQEEED